MQKLFKIFILSLSIKETPSINTAIAATPFSDYTLNSPAFSLGHLGMNYSLNPPWEIGGHCAKDFFNSISN